MNCLVGEHIYLKKSNWKILLQLTKKLNTKAFNFQFQSQFEFQKKKKKKMVVSQQSTIQKAPKRVELSFAAHLLFKLFNFNPNPKKEKPPICFFNLQVEFHRNYPNKEQI